MNTTFVFLSHQVNAIGSFIEGGISVLTIYFLMLAVSLLLFIIGTLANYFYKKKAILNFNLIMLGINVVLLWPFFTSINGIMIILLLILLFFVFVNIRTLRSIDDGKVK